MTIYHWALLALGVPAIVVMVIHTRKRAMALEERIEQYKEEQEAAKSKQGPINPYEDFAALFQPDHKDSSR